MNNEASWDSCPRIHTQAHICRIAIKSLKKHLKSRQRFINDIDSGNFNIPKDVCLKFRNHYRTEIKCDARRILEWIIKLNK